MREVEGRTAPPQGRTALPPAGAAPPPTGATPAPTRTAGIGLPASVKSFNALAMYAFVVLGVPDGMIGTVWPDLRRGFGAPLGDLGIVLLVGTLGTLASSSVVGVLLGRVGVRGTVILGGAAGGLGAAGVVVSPVFWAFVLSGMFIGLAAGLLDGVVNTSTALAGRNRLLNVLHGCYGVGTAIAPLLVTAAVVVGQWRSAYGVLLAAEAALVVAWWLAGRRSSAANGAPEA
ncbi:MAG: MFS transporter, partial [Acidimicrobiales bacterium]